MGTEMTTREDYLSNRSTHLTEEQVEKERRSLEALDRTIEGIILEAEIMTEMEKMWKHPQKKINKL